MKPSASITQYVNAVFVVPAPVGSVTTTDAVAPVLVPIDPELPLLAVKLEACVTDGSSWLNGNAVCVYVDAKIIDCTPPAVTATVDVDGK